MQSPLPMKVIEVLYALQQMEFGFSRGNKERAEELRGLLPPPILARYDRLANRGREPVAAVRDGVCSKCHIRMSIGSFFQLTRATEICTCDNCGRFLFLPEGEPKSRPALVTEK
jgi:uncharacterized protein